MKLIKLGSPRLRKREAIANDYVYRIDKPKFLSRDVLRPRINFFDVVENRRTQRAFGTINERQLSSFLWWTAYTREAVRKENGIILEHRPSPSAGGRHAVDLTVTRKVGNRWQMSLYEPMTHRLLSLHVNQGLLRRLISQANQLVPLQRATIVWFVAQPERIVSRYIDGESLVWRDAGVLIGHMALVAEALNLHFCPLGATGEPIISMLLGGDGRVVGVGGCLLGS